MKKALTAALIGLSLTQLVSGCAVNVGGIAAGGMSALGPTQHRCTSRRRSDDGIANQQYRQQLSERAKGKDVYVNVKTVSYNRNVLLLGVVPNQEAKDLPNVWRVHKLRLTMCITTLPSAKRVTLMQHKTLG